MTAQWRLEGFDSLSAAELYAILALRQEVFVVEQRCAYLDADGLDPLALHLFCVEPGGGPPGVLAYARLFGPGVRGTEAVIGRVATAPAARRTGLGRELMGRAIDALTSRHGRVPIRIGAQAYLERFYESFGFARDGDEYLEDGIAHIPMTRPACNGLDARDGGSAAEAVSVGKPEGPT